MNKRPSMGIIKGISANTCIAFANEIIDLFFTLGSRKMEGYRVRLISSFFSNMTRFTDSDCVSFLQF